jgi:hypothetical protein
MPGVPHWLNWTRSSMGSDQTAGIWRFLTRRQRIAIRVVTVFLSPWILYDKLRRIGK